MTTAADLDDRIAAARLDAKIADHQRRQVEQRAAVKFWDTYTAAADDVARRRWRSRVLAGVVSCDSCRRPILPEDRWVVEAGWPPEHARCVVDGVG